MDRRRENRLDCRLECQLELSVQRFHGRVLNVSHRGLFVRTLERVPEARNVLIKVGKLAIPSAALPTLQAVVARQSWAPEPLPALATGGLGLSIRGVPDAWLELLADLASRRRPGGSHAMPPLPRRRDSNRRDAEAQRKN